MKRVLLTLSLLTSVAVLAAGCTKAQPPRSFVQPNALKKSDFSGVWYYNATVIDAPPTNGAVYEGQYGELSSIKWVVTEDTLFAVRAFPFIYGQETSVAEHGNADGKQEYEGQPLAAWRIQSHFDIIRDYNPSTGEETNRIIESTERPWNERQYFRVDWSRNLAPDYQGIGLFWTFDGVDVTELSYFVSDPTSPYALHLERADKNDADLGFAEGEMNYLDFTAQLVLGPTSQEFVIDEAGHTMKLPSCFAFYGTEDCAAQKVKLRHAFSKKAPKTTYEKRVWDGTDQNTFGFFTTSLRHTWDRQYGDQYSGDKRFVERFNFFDKSCANPGTSCQAPHRVRSLVDASWLSKFTDADLPANLDPALRRGKHLSISQAICKGLIAGDCVGGTGVPASPLSDDQFYWEGTDGVQLTATVSGGQTSFSGDTNWIPPSQRAIKTIPYYPNEEMPGQDHNDDIWADSKEVIRQWNVIFQGAASDQMGRTVTENIFVWCHNPVKAEDDAACSRHLKPELDANGNVVNGPDGKPLLRVRWGDPRYSSILWIGAEQAGGPLGLGPALSDPETGETLSSKANIYGGALDTYAAYARDLIGLQNGEIRPETYAEGVNLDGWVEAQKSGVGFAARPQGFTAEENVTAAKRMNFDWARGLAPGKIDASSSRALLSSIKERESRMLQNGTVFGNGTDQMTAQLDKLHGTALEATLETPELAAAAGLDPSSDFSHLSPAMKAQFSPLSLPRMALAREEKLQRFEAFGYDFEPFNYNVIEGEGQRYKGVAAADIYKDLRDRIFIAVTLHEVGHNMGLRHNFRATFDAMNYFPGYWKARDAAATADHPSDLVNGHAKLYARSNPKGVWSSVELADAPMDDVPWTKTSGASVGPVSALGQQYSSIMDYGAAFNTDLVGLGHYDSAAIKYGYANYVEVFTDANVADANALAHLASLQVFQDAYGFPSALLSSNTGFEAVNYYSFPEYMKNGVQSLQQRRDVPAYSVAPQPYTAPGGLFGNADFIRGVTDASGAIQPQVPYYFCSDEFVGNLTCQRFDFGADAYEQGYDIIHRYENYYPLRNFKRNTYSFHTGPGYTNYTLGRYFEILREQMTWYTLLRANFEDQNDLFGTAQDQLITFLADDQKGWGTFTQAIDQSFQLFGRVLTQPQAGAFIQSDDGNGGVLWKQFNDTPYHGPGSSNVLNVDITDGRYEGTSWNFNGCGYYWGDECQSRIGFYLDKYLALYALSESQAYFTGRDTSVDVRKYAIGYYLPYKAQLTQTFGAMIAGDTQRLAPVFRGSNEPLGRLNIASGKPLTVNPGDKRLDPEIGFSLQMWSGVFGMTGFSSTFDHGFINSTRVFVVGNGEAPVPDSSLLNADGTAGPLASFNAADVIANGGTKAWLLYSDPASGLTYAARSIAPATVDNGAGGTVSVRQDIGVEMLEHAGQLHSHLGQPGFDPIIAQDNYNKYVQNLDLMRSLHNTLGYGPFAGE